MVVEACAAGEILAPRKQAFASPHIQLRLFRVVRFHYFWAVQLKPDYSRLLLGGLTSGNCEGLAGPLSCTVHMSPTQTNSPERAQLYMSVSAARGFLDEPVGMSSGKCNMLAHPQP